MVMDNMSMLGFESAAAPLAYGYPAPPVHAYVHSGDVEQTTTEDDPQLLLKTNAELVRQNAELMALREHLTLMNENAALTQTNAWLMGRLWANNAGSPRTAEGKNRRRKGQTVSSDWHGVQRSKSAAEHALTKPKCEECIERSKSAAEHASTKPKREELHSPSGASTAASVSGLCSEGEESTDSKSAVDPDRSKAAQQGPETTLMVKNIPSEYTRADLLELIDKHGFWGCYDLLYLPVAFHTELNLGYAFVNFTTKENAEKFQEHFSGFSDWMVPSDRICDVSWSEVLQGIDAHIQRYRDSPMMHESVDDKFRPVLFEDGRRIAFPTPTKALRAPKIRFHRRQKIEAQM